jgi:hypothetical protein
VWVLTGPKYIDIRLKMCPQNPTYSLVSLLQVLTGPDVALLRLILLCLTAYKVLN